ncbi:hypothetical protein AAFF_G00382100 [Aldrovandia affinis]|uniref:Uncharacterized protein n=1 Tax=Aldrovandia affinis TaxID=143900 RepID=A0AAD7X0Y6_9TELE|nr:hypothetical protein AAFF_G00382100 [Aldrovandia affinis]
MARAPPSAPASDSPQVSAPAGEDGVGGREVAVPVASSPELFSPLSGTVVAESGEGAMSPFLEDVALITTLDLATPVEWGDSPSLEGEGMAEWVTTLARKRASSGTTSALGALWGDIFLLQEVHLRDEAAFTREWVWGPSGWLEVFRDLPGCLSTMWSLILGGDLHFCLDGRDGVGEGGIDYSARALAEVVKDFSLVDAFRA